MSIADNLIQKGVLKTPRVIKAFRNIHRADFLPEDERPFAKEDEALPIGEGQTISQPYTVAFMLELLDVQPGQSALDIGYGSGWQSALLAHIVTDNKRTVGRVFAIERISRLCAFGRDNISKYNYITSGVVETYCGNAVTELENIVQIAGGFDRIIAAAAADATEKPADAIPSAWKKYLHTGGRIVMPIDNSLWVFNKKEDGTFEEREYPGFAFVPLVTDHVKKRIKKNTVSAFRHIWFSRKLLTAIFIAGITAFAWLVFLVMPPPNGSFPKEVTIPRHVSARTAAEILEQAGIIRSRYALLGTLMASGNLRGIQAGTYFFASPEWVVAVAVEITNPETRKILTLRIPEGSTLRGIAAEYADRAIFTAEDFWAITGKPAIDYEHATEEQLPDFSDLENQFEFLKSRPPFATLEGYLLPDTYEFFDDVTPQEVVFKMLQNFEAKMNTENLFTEIENQDHSLFEILTLASLLEREAMQYEDKRIIAGIIENRMAKDMPLQIDASLMYVTGRGSRLLTKDDLETNHAYNTYTRKGLPIGPIANPGIDSITAALNPKESTYLYYLSDRHYTLYYSKTFEEHKQKKALYIP